MSVIWKEFPEINRRVAFKYSFNTSKSLPLGCHCGYIAGVSASFGSGFYAANKGKNVEVLDIEKEKPIKYQQNWDGVAVVPVEESKKVMKYLQSIKFTFEDTGKTGYPDIVEKCSGFPLWIMSDVINRSAPARKGLTTLLGSDSEYEVFGHTSDFAKYLIDNKIGYVMASPIVQNPSHRSKTNYSLNQGWFWIPPTHLKRAINVSSMHGEDQFPNKEDWAAIVGVDLGLDTSDAILAQAFNDGIFPQDNRFKQRRGANGRFLPTPRISAA